MSEPKDAEKAFREALTQRFIANGIDPQGQDGVVVIDEAACLFSSHSQAQEEALSRLKDCGDGECDRTCLKCERELSARYKYEAERNKTAAERYASGEISTAKLGELIGTYDIQSLRNAAQIRDDETIAQALGANYVSEALSQAKARIEELELALGVKATAVGIDKDEVIAHLEQKHAGALREAADLKAEVERLNQEKNALAESEIAYQMEQAEHARTRKILDEKDHEFAVARSERDEEIAKRIQLEFRIARITKEQEDARDGHAMMHRINNERIAALAARLDDPTCMQAEHGGHPTCPHQEEVLADLRERIAVLEEENKRLKAAAYSPAGTLWSVHYTSVQMRYTETAVAWEKAEKALRNLRAAVAVTGLSVVIPVDTPAKHDWVRHAWGMRSVVWCQWCGVHQVEVPTWRDEPECPGLVALRAALSPSSSPGETCYESPCVICKTPVGTCEVGKCPEGKREHEAGVQLRDDVSWVCSERCFEIAADRPTPGETQEQEKAQTYVLTDHWSGDSRPYRNLLRTPNDERVSADAVIDKAAEACGAVDGDEIEIVVRKTGRRPFGDRKVRLVAAHTYEREPDAGRGRE